MSHYNVLKNDGNKMIITRAKGKKGKHGRQTTIKNIKELFTKD